MVATTPYSGVDKANSSSYHAQETPVNLQSACSPETGRDHIIYNSN